MTSPSSEHISRYRALGEFDNLIRAAREARRALKELREEEAKLNAQSLSDDKKLVASKQARARSEKSSFDSIKKALDDMVKANSGIDKVGERAGVSFSMGFRAGVDKSLSNTTTRRSIETALRRMYDTFEKMGERSADQFQKGFNKQMRQGGMKATFASATQGPEIEDEGKASGEKFSKAFLRRVASLNKSLKDLEFDSLDLDVDVEDAVQSMAAIEYELKQLANTTVEPEIRVDANATLAKLRNVQRSFRDELAEEQQKEAIRIARETDRLLRRLAVEREREERRAAREKERAQRIATAEFLRESRRIQKELEKIDSLPSGKSFRFWALTALSDMSRVYKSLDEGTSKFERFRRSVASTNDGGGKSFFRSFVSGFNDISEASSNLLQRLGRVSGVLYRMPGAIGVFVAALPALISGVGALAAGAGSLASGIGAALGAMAAGPGIMAALVGGVGATIGVVSTLGETLKQAQKAQEAELEAKEKARRGTEKALTEQQKYEASLRGMAPATRKVTEAVVEFSRAWANTQDRVSENFYKEVADQTGRLSQLLPIAENYLGKSATAMGKLADEGLRMITSGPWKRDFQFLAGENAKVITNMGKAGFSLANVFRNIAVAAAPFTGWLTRGIRDSAAAMESWSAQARANGSIADFLDESKESLQLLGTIFKNVGRIVSSFFQTTVDEGQHYLEVLGDITGNWAEVAKAQEAANSPLRQWMADIRPVLSSLGQLIGALARGIGNLASDQKNIQAMISLLDALRTKVLPPILDILQSLSDSGIAVTITEALGGLLEAIAKFLDSGATTALTVFVTVLAEFASLLFNIASLPGISTVLGAVATGLAAIAAVSIVARFTGLFKLWEFFTWMTRNKGNLADAFATAARNAAGLSNVNPAAGIPSGAPSSVRNPPGGGPTVTPTVGPMGSEHIKAQTRATQDAGNAAQTASAKTNIFSRSLQNVRNSASVARRSSGELAGFLGGPWGVALTAATVAIAVLANASANYNAEIDNLASSITGLGKEYTELAEKGNTASASTDNALRSLIENNPDLQKSVIALSDLGIGFDELTRAAGGSQTDMANVLAALDEEIDVLGDKWRKTPLPWGEGDRLSDRMKQLRQLRQALVESGEATETAAKANEVMERTNQQVINSERALANFIGPVSIDVRKRLTLEYEDNARKINALEGFVKTFGDAEASAADKADALRDVINSQSGAAERNIESVESWNTVLLDLQDSVQANGRSLKDNTREGLRNRDALQSAAKATRELYLADIAAGDSLEDATKKHQDRIKALREEAKRLGLNKEETKKLIDTYGDIPPSIQTMIKTDERGFQKVYNDLLRLQFIQYALKNGMDPKEAEASFRRSNAYASGNYPLGSGSAGTSRGGDGYGVQKFATGGPVWGAGTRTSDSIRAWLSNGEFVQPTDAVDHYGLPIMEAIRQRRLDKTAIMEALPDSANPPAGFASGGAAHGRNCIACESGGHKFAKGGQMNMPMTVNPINTKIDKDWAYALGALGGASGGKGWQWQMNVLRKQFPGLGLWSGYRPGSRTLSGNQSYHALGRAVDVAPRRDVAQWIRSTYGARTKELITPWNDLNIHNGRPHRYTGAVWNQHNFAGGNAHNHWAFNQGGLVDLMKMLNVNNLPSNQNTPLPETPRTLSPAATSVVTNNNDSGMNFGDVIINNPLPERGGDSIRNVLYRSMYLLG